MASAEKKFWFLQWDVGAWLKDPRVSLLKTPTRAIWFDAICVMHELDQCGELQGSVGDLARVCRCTPNEMRSALDDLKLRNAADVEECDGIVTLRNRRMRRTWTDRKSSRDRKQRERGRSRNDGVTPDVTGDVTPPLICQNSEITPTLTRPHGRDEGEVLALIRRAVAAAAGDKARPFHDAMETQMLLTGFDAVVREYPVPDRGDGRRGKIDLIGFRGTDAVALELDRFQPRDKSVHKLRMVNALRVIVLRSNVDQASPDGIDAVIGAGHEDVVRGTTASSVGRGRSSARQQEHDAAIAEGVERAEKRKERSRGSKASGENGETHQ